MNQTRITLALIAAFGLAGCGAGEEPYRELPKNSKLLSVDAIKQASTIAQNDSTADSAPQARKYLLIRSVGEAPRYSAPVRTYTQGDVKVVTLEMTENGIAAREVDRDEIGLGHEESRFGNVYNKAPVLTIGGEYLDFRCSEDRWGDCTNVEQINNDDNLDWQDKKYFMPKLSKVKVHDTNYTDLFTFGQCVSDTEVEAATDESSNWKGYEIDLDKGVINLEIKHTYSVNPGCFNQYFKGDLSDLALTSSEFISIVALDQLATEGYETIPYSEKEQSTFGFFETTHTPRDETHSAGVDGYKRSYLHRFNPEKKSLTYYLSNNFYKADNKPYLDAAQESVTALNIQNKLYNTGLPEIKLAQAHEHRHGDIRYNNITLFDEPLDNGLAGYGPSAANPLTGEIVSARVNQYSSNLRQGSVRYYRQVRLDYNRGKMDADSVEKLTGVPYTTDPKTVALVKAVAEKRKAQKQAAEDAASTSNDLGLTPANLAVSNPTLLPTLTTDEHGHSDVIGLMDHSHHTHDYWAEHNMMDVDTAFGLGTSLRELPTGVKGHEIDWKNPGFWVDGQVGGQLIDITKMDKDLEVDLVIKLAAQAFAGTLTHELGHNFGLRHNFAGSRDIENFFDDEELHHQHEAFAKAGYPDLSAKADFASQMDYNVNRFATTYQKYDLAALRFGYARKVEKVDGEMVSLKALDSQRRDELRNGDDKGSLQFGTLYSVEQEAALHPYAFCTDGHVSLNSNCNRSDAGIDMDDITQYYIDRYHDSYETTNLRHNRQNFFEDNILSYTVGRLSLFNTIRESIEDVSSLENRFSLPETFIADSCETESNTWFCANQRAMEKSAQFFLAAAGQDDAVIDASYSFKDSGVVGMQTRYKLKDVLTSYISFKGKMDEKFDLGQTITQLSDSPAALKELLIKSKIAEAYQDQLEVSDIKFSGRLLNGMTAPSTSPNHPYVNERDVLGTWPDKLLAVRQLVTRTTQRRSSTLGYKALVDLPEVGDNFKAMLCQMTMNTSADLDLGNGLIIPSACTDNTDVKNYYTVADDYFGQSIEGLPASSAPVARYFGFDLVNGTPKGEANLLKMMLLQVKEASVDSDHRGQAKAQAWRDFVGVHRDNVGYKVENKIIINGRKFFATENNTLANNLIKRIQQVEAIIADTSNNLEAEAISGLEQIVARDKQVIEFALPVLD